MPDYISTYTGIEIEAAIRNALAANNQTEIINGNFLSPVNQRGLTSGTAVTTAGYTLDMWKLNSGSVTWTSGAGITLNGSIKEYFEILPANLHSAELPITINVGGAESRLNLTFPSTEAGGSITTTVSGVSVTVGFESKATTLCGVSVSYVPYITLMTSSAVVIKYIYSNKFPAVYGNQLTLCQRYFQLFKTSSLRPTYGEDHRPTMCASALSQGTITIGGTTYYYSSAEL